MTTYYKVGFLCNNADCTERYEHTYTVDSGTTHVEATARAGLVAWQKARRLGWVFEDGPWRSTDHTCPKCSDDE